MIGPLIIGSVVAGLVAIVALLNGNSLGYALIVYVVTGPLTVLCVAIVAFMRPRLRKAFGWQED